MEPFESAEDIAGVDMVQLYSIQMQSLHSQLNHILLIRGWASTLAIGLLVAMVNFQNPIVALGSGILSVFWLMDKRYGDHFSIYLKREWALRGEICEKISNGSVKSALYTSALSPRTRAHYFSIMFAVVIIPAIVIWMSSWG